MTRFADVTISETGGGDKIFQSGVDLFSIRRPAGSVLRPMPATAV